MIDKERRIYLKQIGTAATLTAIAGCLGDNDSPESAPKNTSESTPTQETERDNTPTEGSDNEDKQTSTEESGDGVEGYGTDMFYWIPDSRNTAQEIRALNYARPSQIAEEINESAKQSYNENDDYNPAWSDLSMEDFEEVLSTGIADIWVTSQDIEDQLTEQFNATEERNGFQIYEGTANEDNVLLAYDGEKLIEVTSAQSLEGYLNETIAPIAQTIGEDHENRFIHNTPYEQILSELDYEEGIALPLPINSETYGGRTYDFNSDNVRLSNFIVEAGQIQRVTEDPANTGFSDGEYELDSFAAQLVS